MRLNRHWCAILNCRTGVWAAGPDTGTAFSTLVPHFAQNLAPASSALPTVHAELHAFPLGYGPSQNVRSDQRNRGFHALSMAILFLHLRNPRLSRTGVFTY